MENFNLLIDKVIELWNLQKSKAEEAERLLDEAEEIEKQMYDLLREAKEVDEDAYMEFLDSFSPEIKETEIESVGLSS